MDLKLNFIKYGAKPIRETMKLTDLVKPHGMIAQLSKETGESRPNISYRCSKGWHVGLLNGELVMYNPTQITVLSNEHKEAFEQWMKEHGEI